MGARAVAVLVMAAALVGGCGSSGSTTADADDGGLGALLPSTTAPLSEDEWFELHGPLVMEVNEAEALLWDVLDPSRDSGAELRRSACEGVHMTVTNVVADFGDLASAPERFPADAWVTWTDGLLAGTAECDLEMTLDNAYDGVEVLEAFAAWEIRTGR